MSLEVVNDHNEVGVKGRGGGAILVLASGSAARHLGLFPTGAAAAGRTVAQPASTPRGNRDHCARGVTQFVHWHKYSMRRPRS
jgi:hypothetical protein